ncbi:MAG: hypothetical protein H7174_14105, partial [Flavobacterium sp.]|nr:hypothetical protein [Flavobacterium sp.]
MEKFLSKDMILAHTTQEDIYMKFLGVNSLPKKMIFSNPFSETDKNPSFSLYYENNILKFNGFNETNRNGDVFQFVADKKDLDCKTQFKEVLECIAAEMNINLSQTPQPKPKKIVVENKPKVLHITKRPYTQMDLDFWGKLGVKKEVLERYKVHSLSQHHFDNNKPYQTQKDSICFAYEINGLFKKYTPAQPTLGINKQLLPHI